MVKIFGKGDSATISIDGGKTYYRPSVPTCSPEVLREGLKKLEKMKGSVARSARKMTRKALIRVLGKNA